MVKSRIISQRKSIPTSIQTLSRTDTYNTASESSLDHQHQFAQNWEPLVLLNTFSNYESGYEIARICKMANMVLIQGMIKNIVNNPIIADIPEEYRLSDNVLPYPPEGGWLCPGSPDGVLFININHQLENLQVGPFTFMSISTIRYVLL